MGDNYQNQDYYPDYTQKLRDIEEKERLLRDRVLLLGQTIVEDREKNFKELQELKKSVIKIKEENERIKEILERVTEITEKSVRKEEVLILQRQLDLMRSK